MLLYQVIQQVLISKKQIIHPPFYPTVQPDLASLEFQNWMNLIIIRRGW